MKKTWKLILAALVILVAATGIGMKIYISDYYHASKACYDVFKEEQLEISRTKQMYAFSSENAETGIIFYPGGKVEYTAYASLLEKLAQQGMNCICVHMPGNLAMFDANAAKDIMALYPQVDSWYIAGHSLGGVAAASYAKKHPEGLEGIIFLASYPSSSLAGTGLRALSIYGSCDGVLSMDSYEKNKEHFPEGYEEHVIEGGCHGYFGDYGMQKGDGEPSISREQQIQETADCIYEFISR